MKLQIGNGCRTCSGRGAQTWLPSRRELRDEFKDQSPVRLLDIIAGKYIDLNRLEAAEAQLVFEALLECGGNQTRAAAVLGTAPVRFRRKVEKYGLHDICTMLGGTTNESRAASREAAREDLG